jgi:hypothetical protein
MQRAIEETQHAAVTVPVPSSEARRGWLPRIAAGVSAAVGAVTGAAPHVLHHVGPLAGAALVGGATGTVLFGAIGFVLALPMLYQLRRRFGNWTAPGSPWRSSPSCSRCPRSGSVPRSAATPTAFRA